MLVADATPTFTRSVGISPGTSTVYMPYSTLEALRGSLGGNMLQIGVIDPNDAIRTGPFVGLPGTTTLLVPGKGAALNGPMPMLNGQYPMLNGRYPELNGVDGVSIDWGGVAINAGFLVAGGIIGYFLGKSRRGRRR